MKHALSFIHNVDLHCTPEVAKDDNADTEFPYELLFHRGFGTSQLNYGH